MAVADLVQEVFDVEAVRGPLATRGVLYTAMGAWATGTAAVFLSDSAGTDGGAAGTAVFPVGRHRARWPTRWRRRPPALGVQVRTGAEVVADPQPRHARDRRHPRRRHRAERAADRLGGRPQADRGRSATR